MPNHLSPDKRQNALDLLRQGESLRVIERATGIHRNTIMRLSWKLDLIPIITDDRANHIFANDMSGFWGLFRFKSFWNLTRVLMALNVSTIEEIDKFCAERKDILHLCGIHCLQHLTGRCDLLRLFWGWTWEIDKLNEQIREYRNYLKYVMENSKVKAGCFGSRTLTFLSHKGYERPWESHQGVFTAKGIVIDEVQIKELTGILSKVHNLLPTNQGKNNRQNLCGDIFTNVLQNRISLDALIEDPHSVIQQRVKDCPRGHSGIKIAHGLQIQGYEQPYDDKRPGLSPEIRKARKSLREVRDYLKNKDEGRSRGTSPNTK